MAFSENATTGSNLSERAFRTLWEQTEGSDERRRFREVQRLMTTDGLPTARSMQGTGLCLRVWCKAGCLRQVDVDPQTLINLGYGDRPLLHLRFRCSNCGSSRTDCVVAARQTGPRTS